MKKIANLLIAIFCTLMFITLGISIINGTPHKEFSFSSIGSEILCLCFSFLLSWIGVLWIINEIEIAFGSESESVMSTEEFEEKVSSYYERNKFKATLEEIHPK